jgi:hypothetical protein
LAIVASGDDPLVGTLKAVRDRLGPDEPLRALCDEFVAEADALAAACRALPARALRPLAEPASFDLAHRYAVLVAAAACVGMWWHHPSHPSAFVRDPAWVQVALARLAARVGRGVRSGVQRDVAMPELIRRRQERRAFDVVGRRLA